MKALVFRGVQQIQVETVPDPRMEADDDVILRVHLSAVCGSDLHVYHGREKGLDLGTVMGHELVGEIVECGRGVKHFRRGHVVLCPFTTSCGACFYCQRGLSARCERGELLGWVEEGRGLQGAQAEYVRVPLADSTLVALPAELSVESGLLLGDVFTTGYYCADQAEVQGRTCAVVGCGPVGLMGIIAARHLGAAKVYAVDRIPSRLDEAGTLGATTLHADDDDPVETLRTATEGRGADSVLEIVGSPQATRLAVDLCRPGGIVSAVGVHTETRFAFSPTEAYDKNLTYRAGRCPVRSYLDQVMELVAREKPPLERVFTHRMSLDEGPEAYALFDARVGGVVKVGLEP